MKRINVTYICVAAEEYPGCADLLYSYSEMNVIARHSSLVGKATGKALAKSDVLVVDESVLARDGFQAVQSAHARHPNLTILLVCEKSINNSVLEYLSIGIRGFIERQSCVSLLRRAIPALYAGEVWMPRGLVLSLRNHSTMIGGNSPWQAQPFLLAGRGKMN